MCNDANFISICKITFVAILPIVLAFIFLIYVIFYYICNYNIILGLLSYIIMHPIMIWITFKWFDFTEDFI